MITDEVAAIEAVEPMLRFPNKYVLVPVEPTREMLDRAVAFALNVRIGGDYGWTEYMREIYTGFLAAAPKPDNL